MANSNLPAVRRELTPDTWTMIQSIAPAMHQARLFGVSSPEQAAVIMLKGHELGLGLTASFELIHVIENKPSLSPRGALALVINHPEFDGINIQDKADAKGVPTACTVALKRKNGMQYEVSWSMDDAKRAGLVKPGSGWEKYPAQMLKWRAVGYAIDVVFPDTIGGMKRADELGASITPDGDIIEGEWAVRPTETSTAAPAASELEPEADSAASLTDLVQKHGAQAVMDANGGKIPATDSELATVAAALEVNSGS